MSHKLDRYRERNTEKPCSVYGCPRKRYWMSQWCPQHRKLAERYGHPQAHPITKAQLKHYLGLSSKFLKKNKDAPQVVAASRLLTHYLDAGYYESDLTAREVARVRAAKVDPNAVLAHLVALWLLYEWNPTAFRQSDRAHTFALASAILRGANRPWYVNRSNRKRFSPLGATAQTEVGAWVRSTLGSFLVNSMRAIEAETTDLRRSVDASSVPFVEPKPPKPEPRRGCIRIDH